MKALEAATRTVLVYEKHDDFRKALALLISLHCGVVTLQARSLEEACLLAKEKRPNIVVAGPDEDTGTDYDLFEFLHRENFSTHFLLFSTHCPSRFLSLGFPAFSWIPQPKFTILTQQINRIFTQATAQPPIIDFTEGP